MKATIVSMREARGDLDRLIRRVAQDGERFVLEIEGQLQAALVNVGDLQLLEEFQREQEARQMQEAAWLAQADALRERIASRVGKQLPDSTDLLSELRRERTDELSNLR
jgi:antitoxin (DNA-binding transcriptional repressor) of toxin-antitoxin stability system